MRRRRRDKNKDAAIGIVQLFGVIFIFCFAFPQFRQIASALGFIVFSVFALAIVAVVGFIAFRLVTRSRRVNDVPPNAEWQLNTVASPLEKPEESPFDSIHQLRAIDWFQFEKLVELIYRKHGYTVTRRGGANADGGIDLVLERDRQRCAVQCKQWKTWNVGVKPVREFLGALTDAGISKGIFITLCGYTGDAKQLAEKHGIEIINETGLTKLLEETDARFDPKVAEILSDKRKFCPKCEAEMILRTAMKGNAVGSQFWGCSTYPF